MGCPFASSSSQGRSHFAVGAVPTLLPFSLSMPILFLVEFRKRAHTLSGSGEHRCTL